MGPLSNNHALKVYADSEEAVGTLLRQADVGRPAKIDKSSDGQSIRVAESAIRKIKDAAAALQTSLRKQGVDRLTQKIRSHQKQNDRIPAEDAAPASPTCCGCPCGGCSCERSCCCVVSLCFTQYFDYCSSRCCFVVLLLKLLRMPP